MHFDFFFCFGRFDDSITKRNKKTFAVRLNLFFFVYTPKISSLRILYVHVSRPLIKFFDKFLLVKSISQFVSKSKAVVKRFRNGLQPNFLSKWEFILRMWNLYMWRYYIKHRLFLITLSFLEFLCTKANRFSRYFVEILETLEMNIQSTTTFQSSTLSYMSVIPLRPSVTVLLMSNVTVKWLKKTMLISFGFFRPKFSSESGIHDLIQYNHTECIV